MRAHEIFSALSPTLAGRIFSGLLANQKPLYKAAIESLAKQHKLRPVFIERKTPAERHVWMHEAVSRKSGDGVAAQLLQIWLVGQHARLLCDFLDALGIPHDKDGTMESLPQCPHREDLERAVNSILEKHDREVVAVYLRFFLVMDGSWSTLRDVLQSDSRLRLGNSQVGASATG
jgi:hypothetical protein